MYAININHNSTTVMHSKFPLNKTFGGSNSLANQSNEMQGLGVMYAFEQLNQSVLHRLAFTKQCILQFGTSNSFYASKVHSVQQAYIRTREGRLLYICEIGI